MDFTSAAVMAVFQAFLLVTALSIDAFAASFAYGTNRIKIPAGSVVVISLVCSFMLALSLILGTAIRPFLPEGAASVICFMILFFLGVVKLFDSTIKALIRKNKDLSKNLNFTVFHLKFILNIYADPEDADSDASRVLSPKEAFYLAVALSLDGLGVGIGAALADTKPVLMVTLSILVSMMAVAMGSFAGNKIAEKLSLNLSWLSGAILIVLSILKL